MDPMARFAGFDKTCNGIPGSLPESYLQYDYGKLTEQQKKGLCTWYLWPGGDAMHQEGPGTGGNPHFWRLAEKKTHKVEKLSGLPIALNFLRFIDSRRRDRRFAELGLINDPDCKTAAKADAFGLWIDDCKDPYSTGIMGMRMFPNKRFDAAKWAGLEKYLEDPKIEPPYVVGLSCGVCHIALNPLAPPKDPAHPEWKNIVGALGNQYLKEGEMFKADLPKDSILYWVYDSQEAGTSDTSRISSDFINNPNAINSIFDILSTRPKHKEVQSDGIATEVPHILKDGADSIGPAGAALRVYVNIGTCGDYRMGLEDSFTGLLPQHPFDLKKAADECEDWRLTSARMDDAAAFLDGNHALKLADAEGGKAYLTADEKTLAAGKKVFAESCARCHSSKVPAGIKDKHADSAKAAWVKLVMQPDFLDGNFLSDDERYPIVAKDPKMAIGTNAARALATNAREGHIWQNFSSKTYKELPAPGSMKLYDPFNPEKPIDFPIPAGAGYYRTPSLISVWATAPLLHNNALGKFNADPSVKGRVEAFMDAAEKLLWPAKRLGPQSIKVTPQDTVVLLRSHRIKIPKGTPINLIANINLQQALASDEVVEALAKLLENPVALAKLVEGLHDPAKRDAELRKIDEELLKFNQCPDFIEDRGHTFGETLADADKRALIEYMKTF